MGSDYREAASTASGSPARQTGAGSGLGCAGGTAAACLRDQTIASPVQRDAPAAGGWISLRRTSTAHWPEPFRVGKRLRFGFRDVALRPSIALSESRSVLGSRLFRRFSEAGMRNGASREPRRASHHHAESDGGCPGASMVTRLISRRRSVPGIDSSTPSTCQAGDCGCGSNDRGS